MLAVALACLPIMLTGGTIARWEGAVFLGYYAAYTAYLVLAVAATQCASRLLGGDAQLRGADDHPGAGCEPSETWKFSPWKPTRNVRGMTMVAMIITCSMLWVSR
jgi:hypothetical protein